MALRLVRVAPGDDEDLLARGDEVLDHAAPRREVEDVVLVDRRRDEQQRHLAHLLPSSACTGSARRPRCAARPSPAEAARLPPTSKPLRVDALRQPRRPRDVGGEAPRAAHEVRAALVDDRPQHGRVGPAGSSSARARRARCSPRSAPGARSASRARRRRSRRRRSRRPPGSPASRGAAASSAPRPDRRSGGRPSAAPAASGRRRRGRAPPPSAAARRATLRGRRATPAPPRRRRAAG